MIRPFCIPTSKAWVPVASYPCQHFPLSIFKNLSHSSGCVVVFHCNFILLFFDDDEYWASFHVLIDHSYISFVKCLQIFCLLFFFFLIFYWVLRDLYMYSGNKFFFSYLLESIFFYSMGCLVIFLTVFFKEQQFLILNKYI